MTFSITTLSIMALYAECCNAACCYDECPDYLNVILSVLMLVVLLSVVVAMDHIQNTYITKYGPNKLDFLSLARLSSLV
jgi:hypothetical protein